MLRHQLNILENKTTIFVVGGSRVENLMSTLNVLNHSGYDIQIIVSAGNDMSSFRELNKIEWHKPTYIFRIHRRYASYILASDLIICKAGGLIVTESLACGTPIIMISVIPGQETGNAAFVEDGKAGVSVENSNSIPRRIFPFIDNNGQQLKNFKLTQLN